MRWRMNCIQLHPLYGNRLLRDEVKNELHPATPSLRQQVAQGWGEEWIASSYTLFTATGCSQMRWRMNCIQLHPLYGNRLLTDEVKNELHPATPSLRQQVAQGWGEGWIARGYTFTATGCLAMRQRMNCIQLHRLYGNWLCRDAAAAKNELHPASPSSHPSIWQPCSIVLNFGFWEWGLLQVTVTHPFGDHAPSCLTLAFESECSCSSHRLSFCTVPG